MNSSQGTDSFMIEVDRDLAPIVPYFLDGRRNDCELIRQLLGDDAFDEIHILAHRMKGAGGSYGFDLISDLGGTLEDAALKADREAIRSVVLQLADYLERVSVVYV